MTPKKKFSRAQRADLAHAAMVAALETELGSYAVFHEVSADRLSLIANGIRFAMFKAAREVDTGLNLSELLSAAVRANEAKTEASAAKRAAESATVPA
jgi:hypothetical protein